MSEEARPTEHQLEQSGRDIRGRQGIAGERVVLREKRLSDAERDYAWRCDPELARLDAAEPLKVSFSVFQRRFADELRFPYYDWHRLAIDTMDGKHIGNCVYHNGTAVEGEVEFGIMIGDPEYRDKGYGADVVATAAAHIFEDCSLHRIYLHTLTWNIRAQRCFRKCGFVPCGELVRGGHTFMIMELRRGWLKRLARPVDKVVPGQSNRVDSLD